MTGRVEGKGASTDPGSTMYSPKGDPDPIQEYLLAKAPDFMAAYLRVAEHSMLEAKGESTLPLQYRELVVACVLMAIRGPHEGIVAHLRRAFELGLTEQEALDGVMAAHVPGGALALWAGVRAIRGSIDSEPGR